MNPWQTVADFERVVADYAGAPYGVAVDSCTNALFLSLVLYRLEYGKQTIMIPKRTYVGVAHAIVNAGHICKFESYSWQGAYWLFDTGRMIPSIRDCARQFTRNMYLPNVSAMYCLSFHTAKHLPIGRGGMILLDNEDDYKLLKRMRFDGRREGVAPKDDTFDCPGYHMLLEPEQASRGLQLMQYVKDYNEDLPMDDYADLSKHEYFNA